MKGRLLKKKGLLCLVLAALLAASVLSIPSYAAGKTGGWTKSKACYSFLNASQKKIFKKAFKGENTLDGVIFTPVAVVATQVVAGTNYAYLAQGTAVTPHPYKNWFLITIYVDLNNKVSGSTINLISVDDVKTRENPRTGTISGGYEIANIKNRPKALPKKARQAFNKAKKKYTGYALRPIALLGKQVVAGENFRILCYGKNNSGKELFVVDVYKNLKGKCKFTSVKPFDLESYTE